MHEPAREECGLHMHRWDPQMIRWMCEAMDYGSYNRDLAAYILPFLRRSDYVCEAGCGLGFLSLELAKHVRKITAFDRNPDALSLLRKRIHENALRNIETCCISLEKFRSAEAPDAMVFCLFGSFREIITSAERQHCEKVIAVQRRQKDELRHSEIHDFCIEDLMRGWNMLERQTMDIPLNQPFRDLEDAREFINMYIPEESARRMTDAELAAGLRTISHADYCYELPVTRRLEMLVLERKC